jgi:predicted AlkP superfamily pyrophosphatase or phosphodiesterase
MPIRWSPRTAPMLIGSVLLVNCNSDKAPGTGAAASGTPKVLFIGIDGLRGDGIPASQTPHLDGLLDSGVWTLFASTQLAAATVSGPGWTSMLTGVDADKHGIVENGGWDDMNRDYPTLIARAHDLGLRTATAVHWLPIQINIIEADVTDQTLVGTDEDVATGMADMLRDGDFDVHFAALDDVDHAGHASGFSVNVTAYRAAVATADAHVGLMLEAIAERTTRDEESWVVVVTSDHGGLGTSHGGVDADSRAIPLIVSGDRVSPEELTGAGNVPGELIAGFVSHLDVHPTIMAHMGYPPNDDWDLDGAVRGAD